MHQARHLREKQLFVQQGDKHNIWSSVATLLMSIQLTWALCVTFPDFCRAMLWTSIPGIGQITPMVYALFLLLKLSLIALSQIAFQMRLPNLVATGNVIFAAFQA
jgi:hypothetical protein